MSEILPINAEVHQGALEAPLLFNIFISDQPTTSHTTIGDYADDKSLLVVHSDHETVLNFIQSHLNLRSIW